MNLTEQLTEIKEQLGQLDPNNRDHLVEIGRLKSLENQLTVEEAEQQRIQVQESKVESITLPYDFSEIFEDPRANEMIVELIKEYQRAAYAEHNAELNEMATGHRDELRAATDRELQLKRQNDELQQENQLISSDREQTKERLQQFSDKLAEVARDLGDALSKRDAAVREKEGIELLVAEKQAQIDTLRDEIAIGAVAAINVTNISPTDRLAQLVQDSKNAKVKSALDIALESNAPFRGKVITDGAVVQLNAPEATPFRPIDTSGNTSNQLVTGPSETVSADDQVTPSEGEVQAVQSPVVEGSTSEDGQTLAEAFRRIEALENRVGLFEGQFSVFGQ